MKHPVAALKNTAMNTSLINITPQRTILIDDDPITNAINKMLIGKITPGMEVSVYTSVAQALSNLTPDGKQTLLFLDLNMPQQDGWDFLEAFSTYDDYIKDQFLIYILSSSLAESDRVRGMMNPYVQEYLVKPATTEMIKRVLKQVQAPVAYC
jgi:response regulator of citrate/malate metabolism